MENCLVDMAALSCVPQDAQTAAGMFAWMEIRHQIRCKLQLDFHFLAFIELQTISNVAAKSATANIAESYNQNKVPFQQINLRYS